MLQRFVVRASLALLGCTFASAAAAATVTYAFSGVVTDVSTSRSRLPGAPIAGSTFVLEYALESTTPGVPLPAGGLRYSVAPGGSAPGSLALRIDGSDPFVLPIDGSLFNSFNLFDGVSFEAGAVGDYVAASVESRPPSVDDTRATVIVQAEVVAADDPDWLRSTDLGGALGQRQPTGGSLFFVLFGPDTGDGFTPVDGLTGTVTGLTVTAVPLPSAIWLLLGGAGLLGLVGSRRRRA